MPIAAPPSLRSTCLRWLAVLSLLAGHVAAWGSPLLVVVPDTSAIQTLTRQDLVDIYLDLNAARSAQQVVPLDRREDGLRERFYQSLGVSLSAVRAHWAKRVFTGRGRPPPVVSSAELGQTLMQDQHALIYVDGSERPRNTRVVLTLD